MSAEAPSAGALSEALLAAATRADALLADAAWQLGVGALLGWAALPLLVRLARRNRQAAPAAYYRALVAALAIATGLSFVPAARGALAVLGVGIELPLPLVPGAGARAEPILRVADWVSPIIGSRAAPWHSMPLARVLSALGLLWLGAMAIGVVRSLSGCWRLARSYRSAEAAPARVIERTVHIAAELGVAAPVLRVTDGIASAFTFGVLSPVVVLGRAMAEASDDELEFVLRHELTHVRRGDARAALFIEFAKRCFSGHPSVGALDREIRFAREAAVDEAAAGPQALEYARFLLGLAEQVGSLRAPHTSLVSMADTALERRIEMLMSKKQRKRAGFGAAGLSLSGLVLGALVLAAPSSFGQGNAGDPDEPHVEGNLSVEQVQQVVFGRPRPVLDCYGQLPTPRENLQVRLLFTIAEDGTVQPGGRVVVPAHPELEPCIASALYQYVFPAPSSGTVEVDLPTELSPPFDERNAVAEAKEGVSQRLAPEVIRGVVRGHYDAFRACYEALGNPLPDAQATMRFTISREGKVSDGEVKSEEQPALGKCLDPVMRSMVFPAPEDGIVTVEYPLAFEAAQSESAKSSP